MADNAVALDGDVVEVLEGDDVRVKIRLCLPRVTGYVPKGCLQECPEGTRSKGQLTGDRGDPSRLEACLLPPEHIRFQIVDEWLRNTRCSNKDCSVKGCEIRARKVWFLKGQYMGHVGLLSGTKTFLAHGCKDKVAMECPKGGSWSDLDSLTPTGPIVTHGFDASFSSDKSAFGAGLYFSPQSCKAYSYAENHMLLCEVALGNADKRYYPKGHDYDAKEKCKAGGYRSVHMTPIPGVFNHEERVVYHSAQCKPVYLVQTTMRSPCTGF